MTALYEVISCLRYFRSQIGRETAGERKGSLFIHEEHLEMRLFELQDVIAYSESAAFIL